MRPLRTDIPREKLHLMIVDAAWNHPYECTCDTCAMAWAIVGPDGQEPGNYGPFTIEKIQEAADHLGVDGP